MSSLRLRISAAILLAATIAVPAASADEPLRQVEFNRDVRPILSNRCLACHGPDANTREADLRLDTKNGITAELSSGDGYAVVPGKPHESQLLSRITASEDSDLDRMPPDGDPLQPGEIEILRRWIEQGAPWQAHWSQLPPRRVTPPAVKDRDWPGGPIDQFILARLEREGLSPSRAADPVTLVRRLNFDLLGLPPTPEDVDRFLNDTRRDAYDRLVDSLLASPHFGERLAAYWLDLVRYADTVGYHGDQDHNISPYRDYVIRSFNQNLPFDQFTIEQLAGDLLPNASDWQKVASGYNRLLQTTHEGGAQDLEYRTKYAADRVRTTASVWMGATMGCCECHDHKFDPYTIKDFYRFAAFFADVQEEGAYHAPNSLPTKRAPEMQFLDSWNRRQLQTVEAKIVNVQTKLASLSDPPAAADPLSDEKSVEKASLRKSLEATVAKLGEQKKAIGERGRLTMITVSTEPRIMRVLARGDWMDMTGEVVEPGTPRFMRQITTNGGRASRLDLARWLVSPDHPQTARVLVNRLWQLFFGTGISKVTDDLGSQGEWPTHPRLLDWLARELIESGWDTKHIVRLIVTSRTYQQSTLETPQLRHRDPMNRLLARQSRFRLEAEMVRDNALSMSGLLVETMGGRSVKPYQPAGYYAHLNFPERQYKHDIGANQYRRGIYTHWQRQFLHPALKAFDAPTREECTAGRPRSNTPLAALALLNDPSANEAARALAARVIRFGKETDETRLERLFQFVLSRQIAQGERQVLLALLDSQRGQYAASPADAEQLVSIGLAPVPTELDAVELAAWTAIARTLLNLSETITRN